MVEADAWTSGSGAAAISPDLGASAGVGAEVIRGAVTLGSSRIGGSATV